MAYTPSLANNSVATASIQDDAVTANKIAADAVGASEIAAGAVSDSEVNASAAIAETKVAGDAVDDTVAVPSADTATTNLLTRINQVLHQLKNFSGEAHWYTAPASTLTALFGKFHASTGHTHAATGSDAPKIPVGSISASGSPGATNLLRGDGAWRAAGATPSTQSPGDSALAGASGDWADALHKHAMSGFGSSSGISGTIVNAKGDVITATADDTPAVVGVGANNTVFTADSAQSTGNKWAKVAATSLDTTGTPDGTKFLRDDMVWAAAGSSGAMTLIADTTLGSAAADITFSSIPGTYKHLLLQMQLRGTTAAAQVQVEVQFNADTGSNYDSMAVQSSGAPVAGTLVAATTFIGGAYMPGSTAPANSAVVMILLIPNYAATVFHKQCFFDGFHRYATSGLEKDSVGGNWRSTAAITSIKIFGASGNLDTSSRATLFGLS